MRNSNTRTPEDMLFELVSYTALLEDLTTRSAPEGTSLTADGLVGLSRLASHMRGLAVDAVGNLPISGRSAHE